MERHPLIDNAKFILIFLVVLGHMIEPVIQTQPVFKVLYLSIYSFHMPAFIFLSGMLSKPALNQSDILKLVKSLIIPFVVFSLFYEGLNFCNTGELSQYTKNLQPFWILWFLYSLFIWKLCLPLLLKTKVPIVISLALSLAAGYFDGTMPLGFSRTFYFLPFFVIGHTVSPKALIETKRKFAAKGFALMFAGLLVLNVLFFAKFADLLPQWLYGSYGYSSLGSSGITAPATRFMFLLIALITLTSVLMLIPNTPNKLLSKGKNSLYVYLWHGIFIQLYAGAIVLSVTGTFPVLISLLILALVSATLTIGLSLDLIAVKTQRLILEPVQSLAADIWRFRKRS